MNRSTLTALVLPLLLAACGSGEVSPGNGVLRATAQAGGSSYTFDCDPAAQTTTPIFIGNHVAMTCPSSDQQARLTVIVDQTTSPDGTTRFVANAVLLLIGPPSTTATAAGELGSYSRMGNSSFSGDLNLSGNGLKMTGDFALSAP